MELRRQRHRDMRRPRRVGGSILDEPLAKWMFHNFLVSCFVGGIAMWLYHKPPTLQQPLLDDLEILGGAAWRLTSRVQVSRMTREDASTKILGHKAAGKTASRLARESAAFRELWWRRGNETELGGWRDGSIEENGRVSDEIFTAALETHGHLLEDAPDLATGLLAWAAWLGATEACRKLTSDHRASAALGPAPLLGRNALHVAASRSHRSAYDAIAEAARAAGTLPTLEAQKDAFGATPAEIWDAQRPAAAGRKCAIERVKAADFDAKALAREIYGGRPLIVEGLATTWTEARDAWSPEKLAARDDLVVRPHPIPHGAHFGVEPPRPPAPLGAFIRATFGDTTAPDCGAPGARCGPDDVADLPDYVFDASQDVAGELLRNATVLPRLLDLVKPSAALDARLEGFASRLWNRAARDVVQVYAGPAGAGAPFHYHEHALNALLHGRKRWWLLPPQDAVYSVRHPAAWPPGAAKEACSFIQKAGDVVFKPTNWAHAVLNEEPSIGAAFEFLDAYIVASNSKRVIEPYAT